MDPQTTWGEMLDALADGESDAAIEAAVALMDWLRRGGFPPQPLTRVLTDKWDRKVCQFVCEQVLKASPKQEIDR